MAPQNRVRVLSSQIAPQKTKEATADSQYYFDTSAPRQVPLGQGGYNDAQYFHWIGEISEVAENWIPPTRAHGGFSNQRMIELDRSNKDTPRNAEFGEGPGGLLKKTLHEQILSADGTPKWNLNYGGANGLSVRYAFPGDDELFPNGRENAVAVELPEGRVAEIVRMLEETPFMEVAPKVATGLRENQWTHQEALAAALVAVNRCVEQVADHHGGPIHPTSGGWAATWMASMIAKSGYDKNGASAKEWADLAVGQVMCMATRHLDYSRKLAGPAAMPKLDLGERIGNMTDPEAICKELGEAILAVHPVRAEKLLVRALQISAPKDLILAALMEEGVPRNVCDDHYLLYPNFAFMSVEAVGWEYAEWPLRAAVRYLATVSPYGKDFWKTGTRFRDVQGVGGTSDYPRVYGIAEKLGLLEEGNVPAQATDPAKEEAWAAQVAWDIAEDIPDPEVDGTFMTDDQVFDRLAVKLGEAMGAGMSLHGALMALSLSAVRLFLRNSVGNPMDVHYMTAIGARRNLFAAERLPSRLKVLSLMEWASGFEITQRTANFWQKDGPGNLSHPRRAHFGAQKVPENAKELLAGPERPPVEDPVAMLDYISQAITDRPEEMLAANGKSMTTHDKQMEMISNGRLSVVNCLCTDSVAKKVFPAVWLYFQNGYDLEAFFARLAEHTALDDYSEMHAWKLVASCYKECLLQPKEHSWLYMCAAAKAVCNHSGCGHWVYDMLKTELTDLQYPRIPGWHPAGNHEFDYHNPAHHSHDHDHDAH